MPSAIRVPSLRVKEADGAPDVLGVETLTVSNGTLTDNGGGAVTLTTGGGSLEVKEADGAPDVSGVSLITVSNGTLTDNGGGHVTLTTGGGSLEVKEVDGSPDVSGVSIIQVPNGSLTDNGGGNVSIAFSGGGDSTLTSAYGSRPAASNDGNLFLPNDGFYIERDTGAAWVPWGPIFPLTAPVDGDFAWINQGSASVTTTAGGIYLEDPGTSGGNIRIRKKAVPGGSYTVTACLLPNAVWSSNNVHCGILWRQNDGKLVTITLQYSVSNWTIQVIKWNSPTSYNSNYLAASLIAPSFPLWFRMTDNTTNRISSFSYNGQNFIPVHTVDRTDFITATEVGFYVDSVTTTFAQGVTLVSWKEA